MTQTGLSMTTLLGRLCSAFSTIERHAPPPLSIWDARCAAFAGQGSVHYNSAIQDRRS